MSDHWKNVWNNMEDTEVLEISDGYQHFDKLTVKIIANELTDILEIKPENKVLEIGCGAGALAQFLDCQYTGIDFSEKLIEKHQKNLPNSELICCQANEIPLESKSFDIVFSWSLFQYFPNLEYANQVIQEVERLSKKIIFIGDLRTNEKEKLNYPVYSIYPIEFFIYNQWKPNFKPNPLNITSYNAIKYLD